jgi:hypothetical protein
MIEQFKEYRRKGTTWIRPYIPGEDLSGVSVSALDNPMTDGGMIAMSIDNSEDKWYVARDYFDKNFELKED